MEISKTIVEFEYKPIDYFETLFQDVGEKYSINIEKGTAHFILYQPQVNIPETLKKEITDKIHAILNARMILTHEPFEIGSLNIQQHHSDGTVNTHRTISGVASIIKLKTYAPDIIIKDAFGNIKVDTKADRIVKDTLFMKLSADATAKNSTVNKLFRSYKSAVTDSADELVHLYEIIDALKSHYRGKDKAIKALGLSKSRWNRLSNLANIEPLKEGRHRGNKQSLRNATDDELNEARDIVREMIEAFVSKLN